MKVGRERTQTAFHKAFSAARKLSRTAMGEGWAPSAGCGKKQGGDTQAEALMCGGLQGEHQGSANASPSGQNKPENQGRERRHAWLGGRSEGRKAGGEARQEGWSQSRQGLVDHKGNMDFILSLKRGLWTKRGTI